MARADERTGDHDGESGAGEIGGENRRPELTGGFRRYRRARFLRLLTETGSFSRAAAATGVTREVIERFRHADATFADQYQQAMATLIERMAEMLLESALGTLDGEERERFDPQLALKLLQLRGSRIARAAPPGASAAPGMTQEAADAELIRRFDRMIARGAA